MSYSHESASNEGYPALNVAACLSASALALVFAVGCGGGTSAPASSGVAGSTVDSGSTTSAVTGGGSTTGGTPAGPVTSGGTPANTVTGANAASTTGGVTNGAGNTASATTTTGGTTTGGTSTTGGDGPCPDVAIQCPDRCSNIQIDPYNCGDCGIVCADGQGCVDGVCGEPAEIMCLDQYTNCGGLCRDTNTAADNCGECFNVCPTGQICRNSACDCSTSQLLCNGGCIDPKSDAQHCGTCDNTCSGAENCVDGFCLDPADLDCGGSATDNTCAEFQQNAYGQYFLFNNLWGAENVQGEQCMWQNCFAGDLIGWGTSWNWPSTSGVKSYVSAVVGWHWGWPVQQSLLPVQVASNERVTCGWSFDVNSNGDFAVAYDLWTHATPNPGDTDPADEIMIWLYQNGAVGPIGTHQATADIAGASWDLYRGQGGASWEVYSFVRSSNTTTAVLDITAFTDDLVNRGWMQSNKYLVSIEAGPEVSGGSGDVNTTGFYCRSQ